MTKLRVYEVARDLGMDNKTLVALFQSVGHSDVRNHMSAVAPSSRAHQAAAREAEVAEDGRGADPPDRREAPRWRSHGSSRGPRAERAHGVATAGVRAASGPAARAQRAGSSSSPVPVSSPILGAAPESSPVVAAAAGVDPDRANRRRVRPRCGAASGPLRAFTPAACGRLRAPTASRPHRRRPRSPPPRRGCCRRPLKPLLPGLQQQSGAAPSAPPKTGIDVWEGRPGVPMPHRRAAARCRGACSTTPRPAPRWRTARRGGPPMMGGTDGARHAPARHR